MGSAEHVNLFELLAHISWSSLQPDEVSCSAVIASCENDIQWDKALEILHEVRQRSLNPDVDSCNAVISACGKGMPTP